MNYYGHACVAAMRGGHDAFVLGAMLPDLLPMAALRMPTSMVEPEVQAGVQFHLKTDAIFHETPTFLELNRSVLHDLRTLGISRGPARACAHVGVEMLIDGELARDREFILSYVRALGAAIDRPDYLLPLKALELAHAHSLCAHLRERAGSTFDTTSERFSLRLGRALAHRPRLAPKTDELKVIADYLSERGDVKERVPSLLGEMSQLTQRLGEA